MARAWKAWISPEVSAAAALWLDARASRRLGEGYPEGSGHGPHIVAIDFGVKQNILRSLAERGAG